MKFELVDAIVEQSDDRIIATKQVSLAEEYLADHFPTFPVLPGVLMLEVMAQAARRLLADRHGEAAGPYVIGEVKALKYGWMVRPGETLRVEVTLTKSLDDGAYAFRGVGRVPPVDAADGDQVASDGQTAVSGRFTMRPVRRNAPISR